MSRQQAQRADEAAGAQREEILSDFDLPWCQTLLRDLSAQYHEEAGLGGDARMHAGPIGRLIPQSFVSAALRSPSTIRAWRAFVSKGVHPPHLSRETVLLVSLGIDLQGYERLLHGGMSSALMDQVSGMCGLGVAGPTIVTLELKVRYKKGVSLPAVLVCRAALVRREGRRLYIGATMHDGEGALCCDAETLLLIRKEPAKERL